MLRCYLMLQYHISRGASSTREIVSPLSVMTLNLTWTRQITLAEAKCILTDGERDPFLFPDTREVDRTAAFRALHFEAEIYVAGRHIHLKDGKGIKTEAIYTY